mmetsp:Transcript_28781/g.60571  ORF Transcript_28781/g.60571 Transcript_28781/m.60571 type:complete len:398 (-) Transcript_28781:353-1546(-)
MLHRSFLFYLLALRACNLSVVVAQTSGDIGPVNAAGSSVDLGNGSWNVTGSGSDIWGYTDSFHFLHFNKSNDLSVTVFSENFEQTYSWAKAGLQIRESLDKKAAHASLFITGHQYAAMQWRSVFGQSSSSSHTVLYTHNAWLRLTKEGNKFTSYYKTVDDLVYTKLNEEIIEFSGTNFYVGIPVTSHVNGQLATFTCSNFEILDDVYHLPVRDVGETGRAIEVVKADGITTIKAAGTGIGGTTDSFGYVNKKFSGDINVTAHLYLLAEENLDSKGGLMIRASGSADTPHVSLLTNPRAGGLTMFYRESAGGETLSKTAGVWDRNMELMMTTTGNSVTCYYKHKSFADWYELGTATIDMGTDFQVGVAVTSASYGRHATLQISDISVDGVPIDWSADS